MSNRDSKIDPNESGIEIEYEELEYKPEESKMYDKESKDNVSLILRNLQTLKNSKADDRVKTPHFQSLVSNEEYKPEKPVQPIESPEKPDPIQSFADCLQKKFEEEAATNVINLGELLRDSRDPFKQMDTNEQKQITIENNKLQQFSKEKDNTTPVRCSHIKQCKKSYWPSPRRYRSPASIRKRRASIVKIKEESKHETKLSTEIKNKPKIIHIQPLNTMFENSNTKPYNLQVEGNIGSIENTPREEIIPETIIVPEESKTPREDSFLAQNTLPNYIFPTEESPQRQTTKSIKTTPCRGDFKARSESEHESSQFQRELNSPMGSQNQNNEFVTFHTPRVENNAVTDYKPHPGVKSGRESTESEPKPIDSPLKYTVQDGVCVFPQNKVKLTAPNMDYFTPKSCKPVDYSACKDYVNEYKEDQLDFS